jgi:hypothetical protein
MEHEQIISFLVTILLMMLSGFLGKIVGEKGHVKCSNCEEYRKACQEVLKVKLDNLIKEVEQLTKVDNSKLFNI